ncbi:hypothetical protein D1617_28890 [Klebsiella pneumoniae]|nr:hypothetical protein D1617_28890 [Klebsiella pneumoniae]
MPHLSVLPQRQIFIRDSCEPVTASWRQGSPATVRLWAINDTWAACEDCRLTWQVRRQSSQGAQVSVIAHKRTAGSYKHHQTHETSIHTV